MATAPDAIPSPPSPACGRGAGGEGNALTGLRIAITRPSGQAAPLLESIRALGGEALPLPLLDIAPPATPVHARMLRQQFRAADLIIFISPNAVRMAQQHLPPADWPSEARLAAVGQGTAQALRVLGFHDLLVPAQGADSEALLAQPEMREVRGRRILIVRGEGGRTLLAETLAVRGARVDHAVLYRRRPLPPDLAALRRQAPMIFVLTSSEALRVLVEAARDQGALAWLQGQTFVFGHPRIAELGRTFGLVSGIIVESPADAAILDALLGLAQGRG